MRIHTTALAVILAVGGLANFSPMVHADDAPAAQKSVDPGQLMEQALKDYKAGHTQDAIASLQRAITQLQKSERAGLASHFPKPPDGWTAEKLQANSMSAGSGDEDQAFTYTTLARTYKNSKDENLSVTITLADSPQLIQGFNAMMTTYQNPQILAAMNRDPKHKVSIVNQDGWKGWSVLDQDQEAQISAFNGNYLLTVEVSKGDQKTLDQFWNAIGLKGLNKQAIHTPPAK